MDSTAQQDIPARMEQAKTEFRHCRLCPQNCGVDRMKGETGFCGLTDRARYFRELVYDGDEPELVPSHHVYFSGCNLRCEFCTLLEWNEEPRAADEMDVQAVAAVVEQRRNQGARTLNMVGGEPSVSILGLLDLLARISPKTRVVWNTNMYFHPRILQLLSGLVDVYLADFKCGNDACARKILGGPEYVETVEDNLRQATVQAGVIIRHVAMPGHLECCTRPILHWIAEQVPGARVSLKGDYLPPAEALHAPVEYLQKEEFLAAREWARKWELHMVE